MVKYPADSPSRMCDGSLDEAARMLDRYCIVCRLFLKTTRTYIHASQAAIPTCTRIETLLRAPCGALS
jgi:hypothetical protein